MMDTPLTASASWPGVGAAAFAAVGAGVLGVAMFRPQSQLLGPVVCRGNSLGMRRVAFTFDDGPWPGSTDVILDTLHQAEIKAAFFVIGRHAQRSPDLVRRIHIEGHMVCNHTFDHHRLGLFGHTGYWTSQIARTDQVIAEITGQRPRLFRPPMGFKSPPLMAAARRSGHVVVAWSHRGRDGVSAAPERVTRTLSRDINPGDILLLHDGRDPASRRDVGVTSLALPGVIAALRAQGFGFARLDELIGA